MKESKKYKQQEEETTKISEPVVAYNSMAYLELEAEKAELIRTIANIDSKKIIDKAAAALDVNVMYVDQGHVSERFIS